MTYILKYQLADIQTWVICTDNYVIGLCVRLLYQSRYTEILIEGNSSDSTKFQNLYDRVSMYHMVSHEHIISCTLYD